MSELVMGAALLAGGSVVLIAYGVSVLSGAESAVVGSRVERMGRRSKPAAPASTAALRSNRTGGAFNSLEQPLKGNVWASKTRHTLERAEVNLTLGEYLAVRLLALVGAAAAAVMFAPGFTDIIATPIAAIAGWMTPAIWVRKREAKRKAKLESQLDAALVNISGALKAGFSFLQACQITLPQLEWPLKNDLEAALEETQLGATVEEAFAAMGRNIQSYDFDIVVNAVLIQRAVGGNLAEILENVAHTIRERRELKGHIMALTAQQRLSAVFVAAVPLMMAAFLTWVSPEFMNPLWTTTLGWVLVSVGFLMDFLGFLVMRRLTNIDF